MDAAMAARDVGIGKRMVIFRAVGLNSASHKNSIRDSDSGAWLEA